MAKNKKSNDVGQNCKNRNFGQNCKTRNFGQNCPNYCGRKLDVTFADSCSAVSSITPSRSVSNFTYNNLDPELLFPTTSMINNGIAAGHRCSTYADIIPGRAQATSKTDTIESTKLFHNSSPSAADSRLSTEQNDAGNFGYRKKKCKI